MLFLFFFISICDPSPFSIDYAKKSIGFHETCTLGVNQSLFSWDPFFFISALKIFPTHQLGGPWCLWAQYSIPMLFAKLHTCVSVVLPNAQAHVMHGG